MAPKVIHPCGRLVNHFPCVKGEIESSITSDNDDQHEYEQLIECNNNEIKGAYLRKSSEDKSSYILLPHDLYEVPDYSINNFNRDVEIFTRDIFDDVHVDATNLYAKIKPKSKRVSIENVSANYLQLKVSDAPSESIYSKICSDQDIFETDSNRHKRNQYQSLPSENFEERKRFIGLSTIPESDLIAEPNCITNDEIINTKQKSQSPADVCEHEESHKSPSNPGSYVSENKGIDYSKLELLKKELSRFQTIEKLNNPSSCDGPPRPKFRLPPVCGKSPPCYCPEDQVFASKLRIRILKKISTLRRRHIRLRVC
jgi:hypothetical protein